MNHDCLFCKIVAGEIPSTKIYEDEKFLAILDLFPNTKGQTVLMPKEHIHSDVLSLTDKDFKVVHLGLDTAKKVAAKLSSALKPSRIALVTEGVFVDHMHIKLFPLYETENFKGAPDEQPVYFDKFPGYITTQGGRKWSREELEVVGECVRNALK